MGALVLALMLSAGSGRASEPADLIGRWDARLEIGTVVLPLNLRFSRTEDGRVVGVLDSPAQGASDIPITGIVVAVRDVVLDFATIGAVYRGTLLDEATLRGTWSQGGQSWPLTFTRSSVDAAPRPVARPQTPTPPFPYRAEEVRFDSAETQGSLQLAGTLTLPGRAAIEEFRWPAVVLISGSGAHDRDQTILGHKSFAVISDYLTRAGIAVLRYDDRGTAQSGGTFSVATTHDFVEDAAGAVAFLRRHPEIDPNAVAVFGHSEGALVGAMLAAQQPDTVAAFVAMGMSGTPLGLLVISQARTLASAMGLSGEALDAVVQLQRRVNAAVRDAPSPEAAYDSVRALLIEAGENERTAEQRAQGAASPWYRAVIDLDPEDYLRRIDQPVLVLAGEKDMQVLSDENVPLIAHALKMGGNTQYRIVRFPGLNHLFQEAETGLPDEYGRIEQTISPQVLRVSASWLTNTLMERQEAGEPAR